MKTTTHNIGELNIFARPTDNPYKDIHIAERMDARRACIDLLRQGKLSDKYELWITPAGGGAYKFEQEDIVEWVHGGGSFVLDMDAIGAVQGVART